MELTVHYEKIVSNMARWKSGEKDRASEAGEMREEIGRLIELTGLNKKAFSFVRMLDKQEPEKREDILRSLTPLLDMMETHWNGNKTPDMFEAGEEPVEPAAPGKPSYDPDADFDEIGVVQASDTEEPDSEIAEEADAFEAQLAQVSEAAE